MNNESYCLSTSLIAYPTSLYLSFIQQTFVMHTELWDQKAAKLLNNTYIKFLNSLSQTQVNLPANALQGGPYLECGNYRALNNSQSRDRYLLWPLRQYSEQCEHNEHLPPSSCRLHEHPCMWRVGRLDEEGGPPSAYSQSTLSRGGSGSPPTTQHGWSHKAWTEVNSLGWWFSAYFLPCPTQVL